MQHEEIASRAEKCEAVCYLSVVGKKPSLKEATDLQTNICMLLFMKLSTFGKLVHHISMECPEKVLEIEI